MKDWIPLIQSLAWIIAVAIILRWLRQPLFTLLSAIARRVDQGAALELSYSGIKLMSTTTSIALAEIKSPKDLIAESKKKLEPNVIYLSHRAVRDTTLDTALFKYYRLRIFLDADAPHLLDLVIRVVYHLHPTCHPSDRESTDKKNAFEALLRARLTHSCEGPDAILNKVIFPANLLNADRTFSLLVSLN